MAIPKFIRDLYYLQLSNNLAPQFTHGINTALYSQITDKPRYSTTTRQTGTTELTWNINSIKATQRADLWEWYNQVLDNGELDFDIVDHRNRVLFGCYWDNWAESWKANGCRYDVEVNLESPYQWTPSAHAIYFLESGLNDFLVSGNDLSIVDGVLETQDGNSIITKQDGYALYLSDTGELGASTSSALIRQEKGNTSTSFFCQFYSAAIANGEYLDLISISDGTNNFKLRLDGVSGLGNDVQVIINDTNVLGFSTETDTEMWLDCACGYDAISGSVFLYLWPSALGTNWTFEDNFLFGSEVLSNSLITDNSPSETIANSIYTTVELLSKSDTSVMSGSTIDGCLLQNPMIFDDILTPLDYNYLRRLCFNRNKKIFTTGSSYSFGAGVFSYDAGIYSYGD
jgi:hypothetical protein